MGAVQFPQQTQQQLLRGKINFKQNKKEKEKAQKHKILKVNMGSASARWLQNICNAAHTMAGTVLTGGAQLTQQLMDIFLEAGQKEQKVPL